MVKKGKKEYKFTNEYGLPILDDSPITADEAMAYLDFLEEDYQKEKARLKQMGLLQSEEHKK